MTPSGRLAPRCSKWRGATDEGTLDGKESCHCQIIMQKLRGYVLLERRCVQSGKRPHCRRKHHCPNAHKIAIFALVFLRGARRDAAAAFRTHQSRSALGARRSALGAFP